MYLYVQDLKPSVSNCFVGIEKLQRQTESYINGLKVLYFAEQNTSKVTRKLNTHSKAPEAINCINKFELMGDGRSSIIHTTWALCNYVLPNDKASMARLQIDSNQRYLRVIPMVGVRVGWSVLSFLIDWFNPFCYCVLSI